MNRPARVSDRSVENEYSRSSLCCFADTPWETTSVALPPVVSMPDTALPRSAKNPATAPTVLCFAGVPETLLIMPSAWDGVGILSVTWDGMALR